MKAVCLGLGLTVLACASPASLTLAGWNENGWIVAHTNDAYTYSLLTRCTTHTVRDVDSCNEVIVRSDKASNAAVRFIAGFAESENPGVTMMEFGLEIDRDCVATDGSYGFCGPQGTFEDSDPLWPDGSPAGDDNVIVFGTPIYDRWWPFYAFRVDESCGYGAPYWCTSVHHGAGRAVFADDSQPPVIDPIERFGCVGWYGDHGYADCGPGPTPRRVTTWGSIKSVYR